MALPTASADRTAIVTGASGGIGAEIARELVRRGHGVTLVARRPDALDAVAQGIARPGVRIETVVADMSIPAEREGVVARVAERGLVPHILVNNAGHATAGPVYAADPAAELDMVEVDVAAVVDLCTRVLPGMVERRAGAVLNVASVGGFQPAPGLAGYAASKAFVVSYTHSVAGELRGTGVSATVLCPGPVKTGFGERAGISAEAESKLPAFLWKSASHVARSAVTGLDSGALTVIPGIGNRTAAAGRLLPRSVLVPVLAKQTSGMQS